MIGVDSYSNLIIVLALVPGHGYSQGPVGADRGNSPVPQTEPDDNHPRHRQTARKKKRRIKEWGKFRSVVLTHWSTHALFFFFFLNQTRLLNGF